MCVCMPALATNSGCEPVSSGCEKTLPFLHLSLPLSEWHGLNVSVLSKKACVET